uniref:Cytochrome P450 n=1 Tax=Arcella intermedia TaxID=1963864 RepID=A0A6B2L7Q3_9EUKA
MDFVLLTPDPEGAKFLLMNRDVYKKSVLVAPDVAQILTKHVLGLNGEDWKRHRSVVNNGFVTSAYKSYYPAFNQMTQRFISKLPLEVDFNISPLLSKFTLDLLGQSIFQYDFNNLNHEEDPNYKAYQTLFNASTSSFTVLLTQLFPHYFHLLPLAITKTYLKALSTIKALFDKVIQTHQTSKLQRQDVLENLLASHNARTLSDVELYSNIWVLFLAGHETTSTALSYAFYELAKNQDIQEKLRQVVLKEIPEEDGVPQMESMLDPPPYLDAFVKENLRHHPPAPFAPSRKCDHDLHFNGQPCLLGRGWGLTYGASTTIHSTGRTPLHSNQRGSYQRTGRDTTNLLTCPSRWDQDSALGMISQR